MRKEWIICSFHLEIKCDRVGIKGSKALQNGTKEQVYDRITFLYVKEWKIMRLIDADVEIEKMSEEIIRAMAEIARWEQRKTDADTTLYDIEAKIVQLQKNIVDCNKEIKILRLYNTAYDMDKVVEQLNKELELADEEKRRCTAENMLQFDETKGYARGMACAIEIVKRGGRDEK